MDKRIWKPLAMTLAVSATSVSYAHADVDIDNDGLIEISTLQELDLMRYDLAGASLNGDSTGCPATGCNGYELVADLDFDTNGNGVADDGDLFWNNGEGWEPLGDTDGYASYGQKKITGAMTAKFSGNGFAINNLYINRPNRNWVGLFANIYESSIDNITLINANVAGINATGILAGGINNTDVHDVRISDSSVSGEDEVGMIAGRMFGDGDIITSINVDGDILGTDYVGGVVGWVRSDPQTVPESHLVFEDIFSSVDLSSNYYSGCAAGFAAGVRASEVITKCIVTSPTNYSGGIFGTIVYGQISNSYVGSYLTGMHYVGGAAGFASSISVDNVVVGAESEVRGAHPGGIFGDFLNSTLSDSYGAGKVIGKWNAAGVAYRVRGDVSIENVYIVSPLTVTNKTEPERKAGLIRDLYPATTLSVADTYWDTEETGTSLSLPGYGNGKTTEELTCPTLYPDATCDTALYTNWANDDWDFGTASDYPVLR